MGPVEVDFNRLGIVDNHPAIRCGGCLSLEVWAVPKRTSHAAKRKRGGAAKCLCCSQNRGGMEAGISIVRRHHNDRISTDVKLNVSGGTS